MMISAVDIVQSVSTVDIHCMFVAPEPASQPTRTAANTWLLECKLVVSQVLQSSCAYNAAALQSAFATKLNEGRGTDGGRRTMRALMSVRRPSDIAISCAKCVRPWRHVGRFLFVFPCSVGDEIRNVSLRNPGVSKARRKEGRRLQMHCRRRAFP